jgi:hypothetical protein
MLPRNSEDNADNEAMLERHANRIGSRARSGYVRAHRL